MIQENLNELRLDIQKQIGFRINNISELKMAHEAIEWNTKKKISFNTLRRFFGFLSYTKPNINSLNILSQYLGFSNYNS